MVRTANSADPCHFSPSQTSEGGVSGADYCELRLRMSELTPVAVGASPHADDASSAHARACAARSSFVGVHDARICR